MEANSLSFGHLFVLIRKSTNENGLPTHIMILRADLSVEISIWTTSNKFERELEPGVYLVRIFFNSHIEEEHIVEIISNKTINIAVQNFRDTKKDTLPDGWNEWDEFYFVKKSLRKKLKNFTGKRVPWDFEYELMFSCRVWELKNRSWEIINIPPTPRRLDYFIGGFINFESRNKMQIIEVNHNIGNSVFVCLPPLNNLSILITSNSQNFILFPNLSVSILISNKLAQTLLTLISSKDIISAKTLVSSQNAEDLLQRKLEDPVAAAIAGYYLLKVNELDRMHDWANNLANWFDFMPDGSIIHAWQMIQESKFDDIRISKIRNRLLQAVKRGIPIFTEGLKRLYEGLNMFRFRTKGEDKEIIRALSFIEPYMDHCDLSQELTTFRGLTPWNPEEY